MSCRFIDRSDSTSFFAFELIQIYKMRLEPVSGGAWTGRSMRRPGDWPIQR